MNITSDDLWDAIYSIGSKQGDTGEIATEVLTRLIELKMAKVKKKTGKPKLTKCGKKCFAIMEYDDGEVRKADTTGFENEIEWPDPIQCGDRLPEEGELVFAWKPNIDGWDIVLGREIIKAPDRYAYWLPMMPKPE